MVVFVDWLCKFYVEENFNGELFCDEFCESMKVVIDGVVRDDIKVAFASMDVDVIFDVLDGDV